MTAFNVARVLIGGTASGVGKTTFVLGLIRALRSRGLRIATFKCGPDYLDPTYHARASGSPSHNLDGWMMGREAVLETFARESANADIAVIEGVMGLGDGASPTSGEGSTAEIAKWLGAPVLLVIDASGVARTIGAIGQGFADFDPAANIAGVICNQVGSRPHLQLLREALAQPPVLGAMPKNGTTSFPERHLGLRTADESAVSELFSWHGVSWFPILLLINTGDGKGKTTAAVGNGSRALGHEMRVAVIQFIKVSGAPVNESLVSIRKTSPG